MALASNDDTSITALDKNKETSKTARSFFNKANLSKKINLLVNNAKKSLEDLVNSNKYFDMVFIDADKENYIDYFEKSLKITNKSGIIITDNVLWYGDVANEDKNDRLTVKIREFNSYIKKNNKVESLILPIGDGLSICRKL